MSRCLGAVPGCLKCAGLCGSEGNVCLGRSGVPPSGLRLREGVGEEAGWVGRRDVGEGAKGEESTEVEGREWATDGSWTQQCPDVR